MQTPKLKVKNLSYFYMVNLVFFSSLFLFNLFVYVLILPDFFLFTLFYLIISLQKYATKIHLYITSFNQ
jgi:hypothetical protein